MKLITAVIFLGINTVIIASRMVNDAVLPVNSGTCESLDQRRMKALQEEPLSILLKHCRMQRVSRKTHPGCDFEQFPLATSLSFFSLVFSKITRKTSKMSRIFLALRTPKSLGKYRENAQKDQGNSQQEKQQGNKNIKEKKDRVTPWYETNT